MISTHSSIFVNRRNISSNLIIDEGEVKKAQRIDEIRNLLGVMPSDSLMYSDYVVVVEGISDKSLLQYMFSKDEELKDYMESKTLSIRSTGGTDHVSNEVYSLRHYCSNYIIILDYDIAGKQTSKMLKSKYSISADNIRFFSLQSRNESELEDILNPNIYKEYLLSRGIDIDNGIMKNKSKKWSQRIWDIAKSHGIILEKDDVNSIKEAISNRLIGEYQGELLLDEGEILINSIMDKIKNDIRIING